MALGRTVAVTAAVYEITSPWSHITYLHVYEHNSRSMSGSSESQACHAEIIFLAADTNTGTGALTNDMRCDNCLHCRGRQRLLHILNNLQDANSELRSSCSRPGSLCSLTAFRAAWPRQLSGPSFTHPIWVDSRDLDKQGLLSTTQEDTPQPWQVAPSIDHRWCIGTPDTTTTWHGTRR